MSHHREFTEVALTELRRRGEPVHHVFGPDGTRHGWALGVATEEQA